MSYFEWLLKTGFTVSAPLENATMLVFCDEVFIYFFRFVYDYICVCIILVGKIKLIRLFLKLYCVDVLPFWEVYIPIHNLMLFHLFRHQLTPNPWMCVSTVGNNLTIYLTETPFSAFTNRADPDQGALMK